LAENLGRKQYTLERASIDELFIDVTAFCSRSYGGDAKEKETAAAIQFRSDCDADAMQSSLKDTVVCHEAYADSVGGNDGNGRALRLGCDIALTVRRAVLDKLGFTLSAGISTSKLVSKLAASYGKPNGQAIIVPGRAMEKVMEETQIRKARMLGGKLGKKVQSLLPDSETTMGSISRLLALDSLEKAIGKESGRWVFDACRGIDSEEVRPTLKVLPKSITAFKSFPKVSYPELDKWTALLARDVMKRVEMDNARNNRIPKSVTVGYTMVPGGAWIGRTFRLPFPADRDFNARVRKLVDGTRKILTERGHSSLIRIGLSAIDFVHRPKIGIESFFSKGKTQSSSSKCRGDDHARKEVHAKSGGIDSFFSTRKNQSASPKLRTTSSAQLVGHGDGELHNVLPSREPKNQKQGKASVLQQKVNGNGMHNNLLEEDSKLSKKRATEAPHFTVNMADEEIAKQLQASYDNEVKGKGKRDIAFSDRDKALACQLQSSYDREHAVLTHAEKFSVKRKKDSNTETRTKANIKRSKIDFFLRK